MGERRVDSSVSEYGQVWAFETLTKFRFP